MELRAYSSSDFAPVSQRREADWASDLRKQGIRREDRLLQRNSAMLGRCEHALPRIHLDPEGCRNRIHGRLGCLYLGKHVFHEQKQPLSDDPITVRCQVNVVAEGLLRGLVEDIG
jgi:hypothetical protein